MNTNSGVYSVARLASTCLQLGDFDSLIIQLRPDARHTLQLFSQLPLVLYNIHAAPDDSNCSLRPTKHVTNFNV